MNPISWLWKFLPSKAGLYAAIGVGITFAVEWLRHDAKKDDRAKQKNKDSDHAQDISDNVSDGRRDRADGVRPHKDAGFRD